MLLLSCSRYSKKSELKFISNKKVSGNAKDKKNLIEQKVTSLKGNKVSREEKIPEINAELDIDFTANILHGERELKLGSKKKKKTYTYTLACNLKNQGKAINEGELTIGTVLYINGHPAKEKLDEIPLKKLPIISLKKTVKSTSVKFPINKRSSRSFKLIIPNVPKKTNKKNIKLYIELKHRHQKEPIYSNFIALVPQIDDGIFFNKANDKKWWWLTTGMAGAAVFLGAASIALAIG